MTFEDIYKQFIHEYPKAEATDYRPYEKEFIPPTRSGIIVWLKNGDILAYLPKKVRTERSEE